MVLTMLKAKLEQMIEAEKKVDDAVADLPPTVAEPVKGTSSHATVSFHVLVTVSCTMNHKLFLLLPCRLFSVIASRVRLIVPFALRYSRISIVVSGILGDTKRDQGQ